MLRYFKGIDEKKADGWMLSIISGTSCVDNESYVLDTNSLHAHEVPEPLQDAKTTSYLLAGLLNCFYNRIETKMLSEDQIIEMGKPNEEKNIPHPANTVLPFPELEKRNPF